ncbi:MAG: DUF1669 domain-containing protein [Chloroflexi bacterium]|nr:MAG: DUF1669 domain-containing protein [Chloroflexota bacterium]
MNRTPADFFRRYFTVKIFIITAVLLLAACSSASDTPTPAQPTTVANAPAGTVNSISFPFGVGAQKDFWQVYFTAPSGSRDESTYVGGIDTALATAIRNTQSTLDIAAFEFNNPVLTEAVLDAAERGVQVRIVTDDDHGLHDEHSTIRQFIQAGIPVVDDDRSGLMHNKFMIMDGSTVWMGSWNYTINGTYRNNNNALALRSRRAVENYQAEFDEMFNEHRFGSTSPQNTPNPRFTQDGVPIEVYFASEDEVAEAIINHINQAESSIRFMAFSFTLDAIRDAILARAADGVEVQGIFETTGSQTRFSELTPFFCNGLPMRQDGGPFILHHKVFIIDDDTVLTGSFNFSRSATQSNDENMIVIQDADLAAQYLAEFDRRWNEGRLPDPEKLTCS